MQAYHERLVERILSLWFLGIQVLEQPAKCLTLLQLLIQQRPSLVQMLLIAFTQHSLQA